MDIYSAEKFFKQLHPGKEITLSFPPECHRKYEIMMADGVPNEYHHVECHHVAVDIGGEQTVIVPIAPHRLTIEHGWFKNTLTPVLDHVIVKAPVEEVAQPELANEQ